MSGVEAKNRLLKGTGVVASLTLISRLLGFVRDLLVARFLGAGILADAFFVAFRIPNLLRSIFAEGALTSAFVPVFADELSKGKAQGREALRSVCGFLLAASTLTTIAAIIFAPQIVALIAPGFLDDGSKSTICVHLTRIMLPYIIFVSLIALVNSALNSAHIYGASAMAQVVMNVTLIIGAAAAEMFPQERGINILAISVIVGGAAQLISQFPALKKAGFDIIPSTRMFTKPVKLIIKLMIPGLVGACVYQLQMFINTLFASLLPEGSVSHIYYADRLAQLPLGVFSIALASVLLPNLSGARARSDGKAFAGHLSDSLRYTSFLIIPLSFGMFFFSTDITTVLFERGEFSHESSLMSAAVLSAYCFGLWSASVQSMVVRAFAAMKDTATPTLLGFLTLILTSIISLALIGPIHPVDSTSSLALSMQNLIPAALRSPGLGAPGIALSSGLSSLFVAALSLILLTRRSADIEIRSFLQATAGSLTASIAMIAVIFGVLPTGASPTLRIALAAAIGPVIFLAVGRLLKSREAKETFSLLERIYSLRK